MTTTTKTMTNTDDLSSLGIRDLKSRGREAYSDYEQLAKLSLKYIGESLLRAYDLGEILAELKKRDLRKGEFGTIAAEICPDIGERQRQRYLRLFKQFGSRKQLQAAITECAKPTSEVALTLQGMITHKMRTDREQKELTQLIAKMKSKSEEAFSQMEQRVRLAITTGKLCNEMSQMTDEWRTHAPTRLSESDLAICMDLASRVDEDGFDSIDIETEFWRIENLSAAA